MLSPQRPGLWHAYRMPALLAIASSIGLVAALIGDGLFDVVGWGCLLLPLLVAAWCLARGDASGSLNPPPASRDPLA